MPYVFTEQGVAMLSKEIEKIYEAIDLLMDRTKPRKIGFGVKG